ncbi:hypothetical protein EDE04_0147 [Streptomyces sp. 2132.2]|uniref:hypothetical protein n=1 Tax=Streptomyces sp. 2132.2 TaxID=2485161 RepID=UPI000FC14738|nr:hypothetical protein [Streptomyces sp. 2132.2]ROQ93743.1 hypothetical protein EDE04_0147 [Streptomyces sp. 2132.2]
MRNITHRKACTATTARAAKGRKQAPSAPYAYAYAGEPYVSARRLRQITRP